MDTSTKPRVLIAGAGSMGILTGYYLSLAGASTTFLVRPHRASALSRPQKLYSYDDNSLKTYSDFSYITSPTAVLDSAWDFIIITLDGPALEKPAGLEVVKIVGEAGRKHPDTKVLLGSVGLGIHRWFVAESGLAASQVTIAVIALAIYPPSAVSLSIPSDPAVVDPSLLNQADQAYTTKAGGYWVDDNSPSVQSAFAELWSKTGLSCEMKNATQFSAESIPIFTAFVAGELLGWPSFGDLVSPTAPAKTKEIAELARNAGKEIARLGMHGEIGQKVAESMTEERWGGAMFAKFEEGFKPFDILGFTRFHHGGKVLEQDTDLLKKCIKIGQDEGKSMGALETLIQRVEKARGI